MHHQRPGSRHGAHRYGEERSQMSRVVSRVAARGRCLYLRPSRRETAWSGLAARRSSATQAAAFRRICGFVVRASIFGGSDGRARALPVLARASRSA